MERKLNNVTEITLKMIVEAGIIGADTILFSDTTPVKTAKLNSDGLIEINIDGIIKLFPYPSGAARAIVHLSVNGWKFWKVKINNQLKEISELRTIYNEK